MEYTDKEIRALKPGIHSIGQGLYIKVHASGTRTWFFRYGPQGRKTLGLGRYPDVTLKEARKKAQLQRGLLVEGIDPKENREKHSRAAADKVITFKEAAEQLISDRKSTWKNAKHGDQWRNTLVTYAYPVIGEVSCEKITIDHVSQILNPIWITKHETATRVRGRIESVINWARVKYKLSIANPAALKGNLEYLLPKVKKTELVEHHSAMPYQKLPEFIEGIRDSDVISAKALIFTILTASRTNEVICSTWNEFDLESRTWTIPKERMKKGKEHRVPLSQAAYEILASIERDENSNVVFHGKNKRKPISNMAMLNFLKGKPGCQDFTVHGFRSSFRDWSGETTQHQREVIEHALAHKLADQAEAAYQRGDLFRKRVNLMNDWAAYVMSRVPKQ
jgi:integrase